MQKRINLVFYLGLVLSFAILILPYQYKAAVYTPNILGWFWLLVLLPGTLVTLIWASIINIRSRNWRQFKTRMLIFVSVILISVAYWFYKANEMGNL